MVAPKWVDIKFVRDRDAREREVQRVMLAHQREHGVAMPLRAIVAAAKLRSTSGAAEHLRALRDDGAVVQSARHWRAIDPGLDAIRKLLAQGRTTNDRLLEIAAEIGEQ